MTNLLGQNLLQAATTSTPGILNLYQKNVFKPKTKQGKGEQFSDELMRWAVANQIEHITFLCFPYNGSICSKQDSLLEINMKYQAGHVDSNAELKLDRSVLQKSETDGSSFPSGGLRNTHQARAYTIRDPLSEIFIRRKKKLMYFPSLLVTHNGEALDDKTLFRKTEAVMKTTATRLLQKLGKKPKQILFNLGLEQEFFIIPKAAYLQRPDLIACGRALVGKVGAKHQQFADHYFGNIPEGIQKVFAQLEEEFLQLGIPLKTKHNEVGNNQFEFSAIFCEAGKAIDQNILIMEILKETCDKHGYTALMHEKPFMEINGSGKHANWSLGYVDDDGKIKNLFNVPKEQEKEDMKLFKLFILITLEALQKHNALYFASITNPGNEVRLGGQEAPPRIISTYLGETVAAVIDGKELPVRKNLTQELPFLPEKVIQEDTDRNRTSSFPYTGRRFEFRALGSAQNAAWPMAVIAATLAKEMEVVEKQLNEGASVQDLINKMREETQPVRFDGDGYSQEWKEEAKKRGLYVNESFSELLTRIDKEVDVFVQIGACTKNEIQAKCEVMREMYHLTVDAEAKALINVAGQKIVPRAMKYLEAIENGLKSSSKHVKAYSQNFMKIFDSSLEKLEELKNQSTKCQNVKEAGELRQKIVSIGESLGQICRVLAKDPCFPDLQDFLLY